MTGHSKNYGVIANKVIELVERLRVAGFKVWRYKIEDTICDSRTEDIFNILN
jgi:hypothetical protein